MQPDPHVVYQNETIVAIATPPGRGGIGIVRLSGPEATRIAEPMLRMRNPLAHAQARFACQRHAAQHVVERVSGRAVIRGVHLGPERVQAHAHGLESGVDHVLRGRPVRPAMRARG